MRDPQGAKPTFGRRSFPRKFVVVSIIGFGKFGDAEEVGPLPPTNDSEPLAIIRDELLNELVSRLNLLSAKTILANANSLASY